MEINQLYCMDNLELMQNLPSKSIDLIYCDILYGTGKDFGDYKDLPADRDKIEEFYYPRIKEMQRLLKDTGSIYLQMDYKINHWIRIILDDVFGYENFRNEIIWHYDLGGSTQKAFKRKHDNILFYAKTDSAKFEHQKIKPLNKQRYNKVDKNGRRYFTNGQGYKKYYDTGIRLSDVWTFRGNENMRCLNSMAKERTGYKTQKPKKLLEIIVKSSSNVGDIVADFFLGSGTTVVVAEELDRKWIGCDINQKAIDITKNRLSGVQKKLFV